MAIPNPVVVPNNQVGAAVQSFIDFDGVTVLNVTQVTTSTFRVTPTAVGRVGGGGGGGGMVGLAPRAHPPTVGAPAGALSSPKPKRAAPRKGKGKTPAKRKAKKTTSTKRRGRSSRG